MLPSMFSGISGLKANQKKLDVVGNNIANSSTTAYKSQRIRFQDMVSQTMTEALGPGTNMGGVNGRQIGLGVQVAGIDTSTSVGNMQPTSRNLDFAIDGLGYFVVGKGPAEDGVKVTLDANNAIGGGDAGAGGGAGGAGDEKTMDTFYTRDGSFILDTQGNLLTSDGYRVLGYEVGNAKIKYSDNPDSQASIGFQNANNKDEVKVNEKALVPLVIPDTITNDKGPQRVQSFSIEKDGLVKAVLADGSVASLGQIGMASFKNDAGLKKLGKNLYSVSANSGAPVIRSGIGTDKDNSKGYGDMLQGMLEMSNVDLAEQFTDMIIASRAFQANGKIISTGDEILQDLVNLKR